jgi:hypothetical protein
LLVDLARASGCSCLHARCVTSHVFSQRAMGALGASCTGLTLALAPASVKFRGIRGDLVQRESFFDCALPLRPLPAASFHVPAWLQRPVKAVYDRLGVQHCPDSRVIAPTPLRYHTVNDVDHGVATLRFKTGDGHDLDDVARELDELESAGTEAIYAEMPLAAAGTALVAETLRESAFSFAAIVPGRAERGGDLLRLQRVREELSAAEVRVGVPSWDAIKAIVFDEHAAARARSPAPAA